MEQRFHVCRTRGVEIVPHETCERERDASRIALPRGGLQGGDPNGTAIAYGAGSLWVAQNGGSTIARIDPANGKLERRYSASGVSLLRFGDGALYASGAPCFAARSNQYIAELP